MDGFENSTGFGIRVLIDLQKLLLCKLIEGHKGLSPDLYPPDQKKLVKLTVSKLQLFSTKIRLIFRSNALLRTGLFQQAGAHTHSKAAKRVKVNKYLRIQDIHSHSHSRCWYLESVVKLQV